MPIRTSFVAAMLGLGAICALPFAAHAETAEDRIACSDDVHQHCGEFIPDREAIIQCLKRKLKEISPACRIVMTRPVKRSNAAQH